MTFPFEKLLASFSGATVLSVRRLFQMITDPLIESEEQAHEFLAQYQSEGNDGEEASTREQDDAVFMQTFIPSRLDDVEHYERDIRRARVEKLPLPKDVCYRMVTAVDLEAKEDDGALLFSCHFPLVVSCSE